MRLTQDVPQVLGSQVQSPLEVPILLKLFCFSLLKQYKNEGIANFVYVWEILDWDPHRQLTMNLHILSNFVWLNYCPQMKFAKVMFLQVSICPWWGACMVGGHVWQGGACDRGGAWHARPTRNYEIRWYGQRAGGTHPTGMHSCFVLILTKLFIFSLYVTTPCSVYRPSHVYLLCTFTRHSTMGGGVRFTYSQYVCSTWQHLMNVHMFTHRVNTTYLSFLFPLRIRSHCTKANVKAILFFDHYRHSLNSSWIF